MTEINIENLLKILPKLVRENDTVKGAIITALTGVVATHEDIKEMIHEMDKRFEASREDIAELKRDMDKRFDASREDMDKRFDAARKDMAELKRDMDKRFELSREDLAERFEAARKAVEIRFQKMEISFQRLEGKEGPDLEQLILSVMKETLSLENIDPDKIRNEMLYDTEGAVFYKDYSTDIDVLLENGNTYLVEVKATASTQDLAHFIQNAKLYELQTGKKPTQLILIGLRVRDQVLPMARRNNVRIVKGEVI